MKTKRKSAITLIVLVITILVLGILASTVIISLSNTDIISEAKNTVFKSDMTTYQDIWDMYIVNKTLQDMRFDETTINLTYKDAEFEKVFGKIPDKYKEGLKVIKGKLVYITQDEEKIKIIEELGMIPNKMKILNRLVHCTTSNTTTAVAYEKSYTSTLTVDTGYTLQKITVVMGGTDITSTAYNSSSKTITINKVTDNVVITATTEANTNTITNNLTQVVNSNTAVTAKTGTSYTAVLTAKTGYTLKTVKVTMAGVDITNSAYNSSNKTITISLVTGDVIITASATANVYTVTNNLTNVTTSNTKTNTTYGSKYTAVLTPKTDYEMESVTVVVNNVDITQSAYNSSTNTVTINSVVGNIVITAVADVDGISRTESFVGCYADVDGDGTVDGVIFADLAHSSSGTWDNTYGGGYSYTAVNDTNALKEYIISQESYIAKNGSTELSYGTKPVIKAVAGSGLDRFYVMSLSNFTTTSYSEFYWYYSKGNDAPTSSTTSTSFGSGKQNTHTMISTWENDTSSKNNRDVWNVIQEKVYGTYYDSSKTVDDVVWFLPSAEEWGAFIYYLQNKATNPLASSSDLSYYNLSECYLSSSEGNEFPPTWLTVGIDLGSMMANPYHGTDGPYSVRLATKF